jgi:hypothetical protein
MPDSQNPINATRAFHPGSPTRDGGCHTHRRPATQAPEEQLRGVLPRSRRGQRSPGNQLTAALPGRLRSARYRWHVHMRPATVTVTGLDLPTPDRSVPGGRP